MHLGWRLASCTEFGRRSCHAAGSYCHDLAGVSQNEERNRCRTS